MTMAPGWYDDGRGEMRWWDGAQWTEHVATPDPDSAEGVEPALPAELSERAQLPAGYTEGEGGAFVSATEPHKSRLWIVWVVAGVVLLAVVIALAVLVPMLFLSRASSGASPQPWAPGTRRPMSRPRSTPWNCTTRRSRRRTAMPTSRRRPRRTARCRDHGLRHFPRVGRTAHRFLRRLHGDGDLRGAERRVAIGLHQRDVSQHVRRRGQSDRPSRRPTRTSTSTSSSRSTAAGRSTTRTRTERGRAPTPRPRNARFVLTCIGVGLLAGLLSGLFGVGGGTVIVPLLVLILGFDQRLAAGTSLAAIVPTATVGVISYAVHGSVAWIPALILAVGAVVGAQIGTWLLPRVPLTALRWALRRLPRRRDREPVRRRSPRATRSCRSPRSSIGGLVVLGVVTGTLAGLLGVGGGIIVVPALMLLFGTSDLIAKGTSLLMMIPTAVSGTIGNVRRAQRRPRRGGARRRRGVHDDGARRVDRDARRSVHRQHAVRGLPRRHRGADGAARACAAARR